MKPCTLTEPQRIFAENRKYAGVIMLIPHPDGWIVMGDTRRPEGIYPPGTPIDSIEVSPPPIRRCPDPTYLREVFSADPDLDLDIDLT